MKRFFALLSAGLLLLTLAACGSGQEGHDITVGATTAEPTTTGAPSDAQSTAPTNTGRPSGTVLPMEVDHESKQDGLLLRVKENSIGHFAGEPFTLTAAITNTTGRDIIYGADNTPNLHSEIKVRIAGKSNAQFTDMDVWGKLSLLNYRYATLKAGETYTQTMRFLPGAPLGNPRTELSKQDIDLFPAGDYEGTAVFTYYTGTMEDPGTAKQLELKFTVTLV